MESRTLTTLSAGAPFRRGELTIIPVERSRVTVACDRRRLLAGTAKEVASVVVVAGAQARAIDTAGEPVDLDALVARASGLRELLPA